MLITCLTKDLYPEFSKNFHSSKIIANYPIKIWRQDLHRHTIKEDIWMCQIRYVEDIYIDKYVHEKMFGIISLEMQFKATVRTTIHLLE